MDPNLDFHYGTKLFTFAYFSIMCLGKRDSYLYCLELSELFGEIVRLQVVFLPI